MNTLQEMIDVMTAAERHADIQVRERPETCWVDCKSPTWDWATYDYRVKPEPPKPREWWLVIGADGYVISVHDYKPFVSGSAKLVHVKEVL